VHVLRPIVLHALSQREADCNSQRQAVCAPALHDSHSVISVSKATSTKKHSVFDSPTGCPCQVGAYRDARPAPRAAPGRWRRSLARWRGAGRWSRRTARCSRARRRTAPACPATRRPGSEGTRAEVRCRHDGHQHGMLGYAMPVRCSTMHALFCQALRRLKLPANRRISSSMRSCRRALITPSSSCS